MNYRAIAHVMGTMLLVTAAAMLVPVVCTLFYGDEGDRIPLLVSAGVGAAIGGPLRFAFRRHTTLDTRDAIVIASLGWVVLSALSALPFLLHGSIPTVDAAFFEMMSGFTTTGATVLADIEAVPHGLLFWRSETHLLGGMGILTLVILLLPHGMGGQRIFRAESSPGQTITGEKFLPRNRDAIVFLWGIYLALNALQIGLQCLFGMPLFESILHAFGTVSTSGYSPLNGSIGQYDDAVFDWIIVVFMFLGGVAFPLFWALGHGDWRRVARNTELRAYVVTTAVFCGAVAAVLFVEGTYGFADSIRYGTFQVISLVTTTGFATADYELWPQSAQMFLYMMCFVGACAGSTTSGVKIVHYVLIWKFLVGSIKKIFFQPLAVVSVRLDDQPISTLVVALALGYFIVNIVLILLGACVMTLLDDMTIETALSSMIACLMNIGPGFGEVGPTDNFGHVSAAGKWFLCWAMLVGRLEMFSALVFFYPSFWRR